MISNLYRYSYLGHIDNASEFLKMTCDKVYQLLALGRWFSPGTPASSITKTGRHDIAEILLKVAYNKMISNLYRYSYLGHIDNASEFLKMT
jgi:hypothetical protein